jgi:glucose/arabinose dehydrogenase
LESRLTPTPVDPINFAESTYVSNSSELGFATGMAWAPDGSNRLFVARKGGQVRVIENGVLLPTPFASVSPIYTSGEAGLVGICFDRDYVNTRYLYLLVNVAGGEMSVIRYTDSNNVGVNKTALITGLPGGGQHTGGGIGIGPDAKLYWAIGDRGFGSGADDDLTGLSSKVGRANLDGTPVSDNPFNDNNGVTEPRDYIWARGFRNPFTLTFQESTGQLWVNDVGTRYEQIFKVNAGDHAGWNDYENNQPAAPPYVTPTVVYKTGSYDTFDIAAGGAVRSGGITTVTTATAHGFRRGGMVSFFDMGDASFDGANLAVIDAPTPTTFRVAQPGPDAASGGGEVRGSGYVAGAPDHQTMGACVTGGAFYTSTAFPAAFRGDFFFGDFVSGRVYRVALDAGNNVVSVDLFALDITSIVDVTVGPDGALYYIGAGDDGVIRRTAYRTPQGLVVTPTHLNLAEGGGQGFSVSLAAQPAGDVLVNVARTSGDADLSVDGTDHLHFTPQNWATPQAVRLRADHDADTTDDAATFAVSAVGMTAVAVNAAANDDDSADLNVSATQLEITEGGNGSFTVALSTQPASNVTVTVTRIAGDADVTVQAGAVMVFTPQNYSVPQTATIAAAEDPDSASDTATIAVEGQGGRRLVAVTALDNDLAAPSFTSTPVATAVVNAPYTYDADASGNPAPTFSLDVFPSGMTIDPATGVISWTPSATGPVNVTVRAANGVSPDADQSFTITVNADQPPTALLSHPLDGATVSGANAEFFGTALDDVHCVRAEFYIDGVLRYTDVNDGNHYHFGGGHLLWDTTQLSNGQHTVRFVVVDTAGQTGFAERTVTVNNSFPPIEVDGVDIDVGGAQRSVARSLTVTFSGVVTLGAGAVELTKLGGGGGTVNLSVSSQEVNGRTVATITFLDFIDANSGGSLSDGTYRLTIRGSAIADNTGRTIDADGDGHTGGERVVNFHRLFGDSNGDRDVDNGDLIPLRAAFNQTQGQTGYLAHLDYDLNGTVNDDDQSRFRSRFGVRV